MIILDIETSGLDPYKCGIWQIGGLDFYNPESQFLEEGRIDEEDLIEENALKVTGKTAEELKDRGKMPQKKLLESFFEWGKKAKMKTCACENPQFDLSFINAKVRKYGIKLPFSYRAFDLHTLSQTRYNKIFGEFLVKEEKTDMGLTNILQFCGLEDRRGFHNGLEDAKLEAECFSRLLHGKNLFPEYSGFLVPNYLKEIQND